MCPLHLFLYRWWGFACQRVSLRLSKALFFPFQILTFSRSERIAVKVTLECVLVGFCCASHQAKNGCHLDCSWLMYPHMWSLYPISVRTCMHVRGTASSSTQIKRTACHLCWKNHNCYEYIIIWLSVKERVVVPNNWALGYNKEEELCWFVLVWWIEGKRDELELWQAGKNMSEIC